MDFLGCRRFPKLRRIIGASRDNHRLSLLQDQIDRLYRSRRLLRQDGAEGGHLLLGSGDSVFAPIPDCKTRRYNNDDEQSTPGEREVPAGAKTPASEAVDIYHAPTLAKDA